MYADAVVSKWTTSEALAACTSPPVEGAQAEAPFQRLQEDDHMWMVTPFVNGGSAESVLTQRHPEASLFELGKRHPDSATGADLSCGPVRSMHCRVKD